MATQTINPFGQSAEVPEGYPIADNLTTNSAQQALSAKQGKKLNDQLNSVKILCVGNSFSADSMAYVPIILKRLGIEVEMGLLFHPGCSLQQHWENKGSNWYIYRHFPNSSGAWESSATGENYNKKLSDGVNAADWDIIVFQQNSENSMDYSTYQPYLDNLIEYVTDILPNVKIAWNLTHAWATGYASLATKGVTMTEMEAAIKTAAESVVANTAVGLVFPYGRAIHFARENETLAAIGDGGNLCASDKLHLNEGLGCQIAAYANAEAILRYLGIKKSVMGDTLRVDSTFLTTYMIPEQNGTVTGSTDANCLLAQKYAIMANNEFNI